MVTLSGMASTNVTPMGGSISNGDASLLISASRLGPFDKNCELVLDGNPDTLKPLSTADLDHFYRAIAQNKDGIAVLYEAADSQVDEDALHKILEVLRHMEEDAMELDMLIANYVYEKVGAAHKKVILAFVSHRILVQIHIFFFWMS